MNKEITLLPLNKKNEEDVNSKLSNNHLFIIISGKQFVKEKGIDILGLFVTGHLSKKKCFGHVPLKILEL